MSLFTISELEQFSGIKAHTIRIWEKRYSALKPDRTEGNVRLYSNSQLRRLLNIVSLSDINYKISSLCAMTDEELHKLVETNFLNGTGEDRSAEGIILQMIAAGIEYDESAFEKFFSNGIIRFGVKDTYLKIIYPLLSRLGIMWMKDSLIPGQEHFVSNIIRQKLLSATDAIPIGKTNDDTWLLFLPENEYHEIGLLLANYLIRKSGKRVVYLGANVPMESVAGAVREVKPKNLLFFLVHNEKPTRAEEYINVLLKKFPGRRIHVSGNPKLIGKLSGQNNFNWIQSVEQLEALLAG